MREFIIACRERWDERRRWRCSQCEHMNPKDRKKCEACGATKPRK